ncbi:uncharacterized protein LOC133198105 [Saccostrea echinata]|uniref:uncharacterized protein LOC133198105 n=1 Tax=Saccostrea echinata TaxID=191078 RepID=UPI002A80B33B|nr:uncharacterized protein LOC133198105 [Saccostrea echinata]
MNKSQLIDLQIKFWEKVVDHEFKLGHVISFRDWYGETTFFIKLTPYLWLIPLIVTVTLLVVFKRAKLYGYTQKYLVAIMMIDVLFTLLTGIRDGILTWLDMDYGYIEYKICRFLMSVLAPTIGKRNKVKYLILIKLNMILCISFILQEVPLFTYATIILRSNDLPFDVASPPQFNFLAAQLRSSVKAA